MTACSARHARAQAGFGYLGMLLALLFVGQGMVALALVDQTVLRRQKERELLVIGRQFITAIGRYHASGNAHGVHRYPSSLQELLEDTRGTATRRHLRRLFVDPMTGQAQWAPVMEGGRLVGVHSLSPEVPLRQAGFDDDMPFAGAGSYREWRFIFRPPQSAY